MPQYLTLAHIVWILIYCQPSELQFILFITDIGIYLSYCDFQSYVISNLGCTKELNKWFTKKFEKVCFYHDLTIPILIALCLTKHANIS
jgi:hypothetical protein